MKYNIMCLISLLLAAACKSGPDIRTRRVAGTPVSLELSSEFFADPSIAGFRHTASSATILVASLPVSYSQALIEMSAARLKQLGERLVAEEDIRIDNVDAKLYKLAFQSEGYNFNQWRLLLPSESNILTISGTFPADEDKSVSSTIRKVLLTAHLDTEWKPDLGMVKFELKPDSTLRLAKVEGSSLVYTADGAWTKSSIASYSLFTGSAEGRVVNADQFLLESFQRRCSDCNILGRDSMEVASLKGKEIWGTIKDSLGTHLKYEAMVFDNNMYYLVLGTSAEQDDRKLAAFRNAVRRGHKR